MLETSHINLLMFMLEKPCFMFVVLLFLASQLLFSRLFLLHIRPPDKSVYHNQKSFSYFSKKDMLWVHKRTASVTVLLST